MDGDEGCEALTGKLKDRQDSASHLYMPGGFGGPNAALTLDEAAEASCVILSLVGGTAVSVALVAVPLMAAWRLFAAVASLCKRD